MIRILTKLLERRRCHGVSPRRREEDHLIGCPCGGRFLFANSLLCPVCGKMFSEPMLKTIYMVVLGECIDGGKQKVWKE